MVYKHGGEALLVISRIQHPASHFQFAGSNATKQSQIAALRFAEPAMAILEVRTHLLLPVFYGTTIS